MTGEVEELQTIKKLMIMQLLKQGYKAGTIAKVIGMDPGDFSRMFPVKKLLGEE